MEDSSCSVKLAFSDSVQSDSHLIPFKSFSEAQRLYNRIAERWLDFERKKSTAELIREAEKELYF
jgi:hypothetical protein